VFLTASNQIVNDLRSMLQHIEMHWTLAGLETCCRSAQEILTSIPGEPLNFVEFDQNFGLAIG
jgi:hypothetical protein